jgi:hypothetical protein
MIEKMPPVVCEFLEIFVDLVLLGIDDAFFKPLGIVVIEQKKNGVFVELELFAADGPPFFQLPLNAGNDDISALRNLAGIGLLGLLLAKIVYETATGSTIFVDNTQTSMTAVPLSHLAGGLVGI